MSFVGLAFVPDAPTRCARLETLPIADGRDGSTDGLPPLGMPPAARPS